MKTLINDNTEYIEFSISSYDEFIRVSHKLITKYPPIGWRRDRYNSINTSITGKTTIIYYRINDSYIYMFYKPADLNSFRESKGCSSTYAVYNQHKILKYNKEIK